MASRRSGCDSPQLHIPGSGQTRLPGGSIVRAEKLATASVDDPDSSRVNESPQVRILPTWFDFV